MELYTLLNLALYFIAFPNEYKDHYRIRAHIEPKQGEMKNLHGMRRAKFRGLERVKIQNYMSAIVTNCKKWVAVAS